MVDFKLDKEWKRRQDDSYTVCKHTGCTNSGGKCVEIAKAMELGKLAVTQLNESFDKPICLEFEKISCPYLLFAKKRYAGLIFTDSPHASGKPDCKGLEKRDKCKFVTDTHQTCINSLLYSDMSKQEVDRSVALARTQVEALIVVCVMTHCCVRHDSLLRVT